MGARSFVYWDLDMFAIQHWASLAPNRPPKALRHVFRLTMVDVQFVIDEAERRRAVETGAKTLHARISGRIIEADPADLSGWTPVACRFPAHETFVELKHGRPVSRAEQVYMEVQDHHPRIYVRGFG